LSRDLLIRTIAYRMQELAYGSPNGTALAAKFTLLLAAMPRLKERAKNLGDLIAPGFSMPTARSRSTTRPRPYSTRRPARSSRS
jgi:hypothetical protein